MTLKFLILAAAVLAGGLAALTWTRTPAENGASGQQGDPPGVYRPTTSAMHAGPDTAPTIPVDQVVVPELSPAAKQGKFIYDKSCAACHGLNVAGTDKGPPLIHSLYRPGHHPDEAFFSAVTSGVRAHHWKFGNMAPIPGGVSEDRMRLIIRYIREMQVANGVR